MDEHRPPPRRKGGRPGDTSRNRNRPNDATESVNDSKAKCKSSTSLNTLNGALDPSLWDSIRWQAISARGAGDGTN
jgi:hypothetical protein